MTRGDGGGRIAVIGAGVIGMTTALALQRQGHTVSVLDPQGPGEGASYGNAGFLATELIDPLSTPATLRKAPWLWLDPHGALALPLRYLPRLAPWLMRFVAAARPARVAKGRQALAALNGAAVAAWQRCLARGRGGVAGLGVSPGLGIRPRPGGGPSADGPPAALGI